MSLDGSDRRLDEVFVAHRAQLRGIALRIVGTAEVADEITQDAYLKLIDGETKRQIDKPFCYCCQVVRNLALDHCRRRAVESAVRVYTDDGELPQVAGGEMPEQLLNGRAALHAIERALAALPERTRHVFELYRLTGLTQREIAKQMKCSATLVNFMLKDAVAALAPCRELLENS